MQPSTSRASSSTTSSAPRRRARFGSARRKSPSRPRSSRRYRDLFTRLQIDALREAEAAAPDDERERLYRLRKTCEAGVISAEIAEQEDALENAILGARVTFRGEEMPLRAAQAKLAVLDSYADREELGELERADSAAFNPDRRTLLEARELLEAEITGEPDPIARSAEEKAISLRELERVLVAASDATTRRIRPAARHLVREAARPRARRAAVERARSLSPSAVAARVDVHEGRLRSRSASRRRSRSAST